MKHVVIIGSAFSGNKGAAAMLESSVQTLNQRYGEENIHYTLLSMYPEEDQKLNPYRNLKVVPASALQLGVVINTQALCYRIFPFLRDEIAKRSAAISALRDADVLLDQGGITFVDGREKFLLYNVASILPALMVGTPVVKCAQALGPFQSPINSLAAKLFLPKMAAIVSRGAITHEHLQELKLSNVSAGADYAFLLDVSEAEAASASKKFDLSAIKSKTIVGVSPSVVMQKKVDAAGGDYAKEMVDFIDYLTTQDYGVMLVPHSVRSGTNKTHNNDLPLCSSIYSRIKDASRCVFLNEELSSQELRYFIGQCDFFVASRFHAMVSSLAMAVPTLVIGWSHKYREVLKMFELEAWAFGQDKLSGDFLIERFEALVENRDQIREKLLRHLPEVKQESSKQVDTIVAVVEANGVASSPPPRSDPRPELKADTYLR